VFIELIYSVFLDFEINKIKKALLFLLKIPFLNLGHFFVTLSPFLQKVRPNKLRPKNSDSETKTQKLRPKTQTQKLRPKTQTH
jgi:hypothetical protein